MPFKKAAYEAKQAAKSSAA